MGAETNSMAPSNNQVGGFPVTSVDELSGPASSSPPATGTRGTAAPVASAGANQQQLTNVPLSLGRTAPAQLEPTSTSAKDLARPAMQSTISVFSTDSGTGVQGNLSATWSLDPKTSIIVDLRERIRFPDGKPGLADHQVTFTAERVLAQDSQFKLTGAASLYGRVNTPVRGGEITAALGVRGELTASYKPATWLELRANAFVESELPLPTGRATTKVGGDLRATATEPSSKVAGSLGVRGELNVTDRGEPLSAIYARVTVPVSKAASLFGELYTSPNGNGSGTPSSLYTRDDWGVGGRFGVQVKF
jgi:hypothetical protein